MKQKQISLSICACAVWSAFEPRQKQRNDLCAQQRLRSAWASTHSNQSLLYTQWVAKDPSFLHADSEDSDQTERMLRLICFFFLFAYGIAERGSSVRCESAWYVDGRGFDPHAQQYSFMEIGHEIISTAILSLPLIQEEQLSVTGERTCTKYW